MLTLDKERDFGIVSPPEAGAHFMQDGFYFDAHGDLVADSWLHDKDAQARIVKLEKEQSARKAADALYQQMLGADAEKVLTDLGIDPAKVPDEDNDMDIVGWARGDKKYPWFAVQKAAKEKYGFNASNAKSLVAALAEGGFLDHEDKA